jgi:hypothetical protein
MGLIGVGLLVGAILTWQNGDYQVTNPEQTMRLVVPAVTLAALGVQTFFSSFFLSMIGSRHGRPVIDTDEGSD